MFKQIMVPLDGSELAEKALPRIANLSKQLDATLLLLSVVEPRIGYLNPFDTDLVLADESALIEDAERYVDKVRQTLSKFGGLKPEKIRGIVTVGQPVEQITDLTPFEEVDLIAMTTHARTGLSRLLMGSIATGVLRLVDVPVMLTRPAAPKTKDETWSLAEALTQETQNQTAPRLLVTLDGTIEAETILEPVTTLAANLGANVYIVRVEAPVVPIEYGNVISDYGAYYGRELKQENEQRHAEADRYLNTVQAAFLAKGISCVKVIRYGLAADQILDCALEIGANLIAMATHARSRIGQFMLGSVAEEVIARSHLPVMLVHSAQSKPTEKNKSSTDIHPASV